MGWFILQAESLERFRLRNAVRVKALVAIEFIYHLLEFFSIDDSAHHVESTPSTGLIEVTVIEHVTFLEIVSC